MNSLGLDPRITLAVYIGGAVLFVTFLVVMFVYSSRMKARKDVQQLKGRPPVDTEEGIEIATENRNK